MLSYIATLYKANASDQQPIYVPDIIHADALTSSAYRLVKQISLFTERLEQAMDKLEPSIISRYLVELAQQFNRFYHDNIILVENESLKQVRLSLVHATKLTLKIGLSLIGLSAPEKI